MRVSPPLLFRVTRSVVTLHRMSPYLSKGQNPESASNQPPSPMLDPE